MEQMIVVDAGTGASCNLNDEDVRIRLREWAALRDRAQSVEPMAGGVSLTLPDSEPLEAVMDLVVRESDCCPFYDFSIHVAGSARRLVISAGTGGEPAVHVLLAIDTGSISRSAERRTVEVGQESRS